MAIIAFLWFGERPGRVAIAGMLLGLWAWRCSSRRARAPRSGLARVLSLLASVAWALGSVYQRRAGRTDNLILATALQMIIGGVLLAGEAAVLGEWRSFDVHAVSSVSLPVCVAGRLRQPLRLQRLSLHDAERQHGGASTYAYVNPVVAVIIGMLAFHERFTPIEALASAIILAGVALMMLPVRAPA